MGIGSYAKGEIVRYFLLAICLFAFSCNADEFDLFNIAFTTAALQYGITVKPVRVKFGNPRPTELSSHNLGMCIPGNALYPAHIDIDKEQWERLNDTEREILIIHEQAHCVLGKQHGDGIMSARIIEAAYYLNNREVLLNQLFGGGK